MDEAQAHRFAIADLDLLFERLARAGFKVGPAGRSRASALITEFVARDALPLDAMDLARWLQPLFVTHAQERTLFMETVKAWARAAGRLEDAPPPAEPDKRDFWDKPATPPPIRVPLLRRVPRGAWVGAAAVLLIVAGVAAPPVRDAAGRYGRAVWEWFQPREETKTADVAPPPSPTPDDVPEVEAPDTTGPDRPQTSSASQDELLALVNTVIARAQPRGFAPTIEELYATDEGSGASGQTALPGDAETTARAMGIAADRPLPLYRSDVADRLMQTVAAAGSIEWGTTGTSVSWDSPFGPVQFDFAQPVQCEEYDRVEQFRFSTRTRFKRRDGVGGAKQPTRSALNPQDEPADKPQETPPPSTTLDLPTGADEVNVNPRLFQEFGTLGALNPDAPAAMRAASSESTVCVLQALTAPAADATARRLLSASGAYQVELPGLRDPVQHAAFSSDGTHVLTMSDASGIRVWETAIGRAVAAIANGNGRFQIAAFSPDGARILTGSSDNTARLWDARTGDALAVLSGHQGAVVSISFSADGRRVATTSADQTLRVWDVATGRQISQTQSSVELWDASLNSDGSRAVYIAGGQARVQNVQDGTDVGALADPAAVGSATFSPDGSRIITASTNSVRVWSSTSFQELQALHAPNVVRAEFSADGAQIFATSRDGELRVWDASGRQISAASFGDIRAVSTDGESVITAFTQGAAIRRVAPLVLQPIADEMQHRAFTSAQLGARVRDLLGMPDFPQVTPDQEAAMAPGELQDLRDRRSRSASDEDIARAWALLSFDMGWPLNISDPPWPSRRARDPDRFESAKYNAPWIVAGLIALGAIALWLYAAFNTRGFLARRRPNDPGRVADLATEDRARRERVDLSLRLAARRLLERTDRGRQLDIAATVDATARAGGFFTPVSRAYRRIPEYLFLIDSRSRFDHDARRALDYVERLRAENVKADYFFYERAPDRVREEIGKPLTPIETITSQYATRRLVLVGDAAAMLERDGRVGAWQDAVKVWEERALLTTVPAAEWGNEEQTVAQSLGMIVRPLSASALAELPGDIRPEERDLNRRVAASSGLGERALPPALRESAHLWLLETPPPYDDVERMLAELMGYLGQHGFRWLSACAVYPALQWDLTMALGWRLEEGEAGAKRPLVNEQRVALLSELPWMRAGQMPQWLRGRLMEEMSPVDRQAIRAFLGELLDRARAKTTAPPKDAIVLSFSVEGGAGRDAYDDDVFVKFLLEDPKSRDPSALEATQKVRELLLPPLIVRLLRPPELAVLIGGAILAGAALVITPRLTDTLATGAWVPLIALALIPLLIWNARPLAAAAWRFASDPVTPVRAWWDSQADRRRLKREDRAAYLDLVLPHERRITAAVAAVALALFGFAVFVTPLMAAVGLSPLFGIDDLTQPQRMALRQSLGEAAFGWVIIATGAALLAWTTAVCWASLRLARMYVDRSVGAAAPPPVRTTALTIAGVCGLLTVLALNVAALMLLNSYDPWVSVILPLIPGLFAMGAGLQGVRLRRLTRSVLRLRAGLPEKPLARVEVVLNSRLPGRDELARELRDLGLSVGTLNGVSLEAARERYSSDQTRLIHIGAYEGRSFGFNAWREHVINVAEEPDSRIDEVQVREAITWTRQRISVAAESHGASPAEAQQEAAAPPDNNAGRFGWSQGVRK